MKNKKLSILTFLTFFAAVSMMHDFALAQSSENSATPEIFSEPGAKLLITEVNFKNKESDWVELYYESPTNKPLNIKNFQFQDDSVFKKITGDYWITSKDYYLLQFKKTDANGDNQQTKILTTTRTGLTATTEQIIFKDPAGKILDAICWTSATPTTDEIQDLEKIFEGEGWVSSNASSCFQSAKVSTNQSLIRINFKDTDSVSDWTVTDDLTPGKTNDAVTTTNATVQPNSKPVIVSSSTQQTRQQQSNATAQTTVRPEKEDEETETAEFEAASAPESKPTASTKKTKTSKSTAKKTSTSKKSSKKSTARKYKNGNVSADIIISEIYPRANEDDRKNEWIELTNIGEEEINMGNWRVDDDDGGSKPYILPDTLTIPPQGAIVIKASESKLSLANSKDMVRLFDPEGKLLQTVEYEEAPKGQSYAFILIQKEDGSTEEQWLWEKAYTPGEPNPRYWEFTGTITSEPEFGETYHFKFQKTDEENATQGKPAPGSEPTRELRVIFDESLIAGPLAKATFQPGARIKIIGLANPEKPHEFQLKQYEVTASPASREQGSSPWVLLGLLPPGGAGFWYGLKKLRKFYGARDAHTSS